MNRGNEARKKEGDAKRIELLIGLASGENLKGVAFNLGMNHKTAEYHMGILQNELGIRGTANLTRYAIREGLIEA